MKSVKVGWLVYVPLVLWAASPVAGADDRESTPARRFELGEALMTVLRERYRGLIDLEFEFDEWRRSEGPTERTERTITGSFRLRFADGAYHLSTNIMRGSAQSRTETAVLRGTNTLLFQGVRGGRKVLVHHTQAAVEMACIGYCVPFEHLLAAAQPDRYAVELIGWERVRGTNCAHVVLYDRTIFGHRLDQYIRSTDVEAMPPEAGEHLWIDVDRAVVLRRAVVARGKAGKVTRELQLEPMEFTKLHRIDWSDHGPPLWVPGQWRAEWTMPWHGTGAAKLTGQRPRIKVSRRLVVIRRSVRVNVGFQDDAFRIPPPPDAVQQTSDSDPLAARYGPPPGGPVLPVAPTGPLPWVDAEKQRAPVPNSALAAPARRQLPWLSIGLGTGGLVVLLAAWLLRRRFGA